MGVDLQPRPGTVAGHADIAVAVTGLARLEIAPRLDGMIGGPCVGGDQAAGMTGLTQRGVIGTVLDKYGMLGADTAQLDIAELPSVGQELEVSLPELGVALDAVRLVLMAPGAGLRVVHGFNGMDLQPVGAVALGDVIPLVILGRELYIDSSTLMAIQAKSLVMALGTVSSPFIGQQPMPPHPVGIVVRGNPLRLVTVVAFGNFHGCIILVGLLLGNSLLDKQC